MRSLLRISAGAAASIALVASSTVAVASAPAPVVHGGYQVPNAWFMLTALSPSTTVLGSAASAAQPTEVPPTDAPPADVPPPGRPPLPSDVASGGVAFGELLPIALWFGLIAVALKASGSSGANKPTTTPISPA